MREHCRKSCKGPIANVEPATTNSAPLDSCWYPISGTGSFLYLHNELGVVLCRAHNTCVPKEFLVSHMQKQHHVTVSIPNEFWSRINETNSEFLENFYNRPVNAIIPNIEVHLGHFKCTSCPKIYSKKRNAATHFKYLHSGLTAGNFSRVDCQTLFQHPLHLRYFVVAENSIENAALYYVEAIPNFEEDVSVDESGTVPLIEQHKRKQEVFDFQSQYEIDFQSDKLHSHDGEISNDYQDFESCNNVGEPSQNGHSVAALNSEKLAKTSLHYDSIEMVGNRNRLSARIHKWFKSVPA